MNKSVEREVFIDTIGWVCQVENWIFAQGFWGHLCLLCVGKDRRSLRYGSNDSEKIFLLLVITMSTCIKLAIKQTFLITWPLTRGLIISDGAAFLKWSFSFPISSGWARGCAQKCPAFITCINASSSKQNYWSTTSLIFFIPVFKLVAWLVYNITTQNNFTPVVIIIHIIVPYLCTCSRSDWTFKLIQFQTRSICLNLGQFVSN